MTNYIECDECHKKMTEDDLRAEVSFEGHMMVREPEHYCIKCWDSMREKVKQK